MQEEEHNTRKDLEERLSRYVLDTFSYIKVAKDFVNGLTNWILMRETELHLLLDIQDRAASVKQTEQLQEELSASLKTSLMGLQTLDVFLDAVERLAVTSVQVFQEENPVLLLPEGGDLGTVQDIITAAKNICPLLVEFKRDNKEFFSPKLQNVEVLAYQLDQYIQAVQKICATIKKGPLSDFSFFSPVVNIDEEISEDNVQKMLDIITLLQELRQDEAFRMVFLFQEEYCSSFMQRFSESEPRMLQFLKELEETAVQLDRMNKGARISSVTGSSVGAVGGILSIIGLALIPVTAGASLALTLTGVGLGITSGVNSAVTTATEIGVNRTQQKRASETFQKFMEDVSNLQDCLLEMIQQTVDGPIIHPTAGVAMCAGVAAAAAKAVAALPRVAAELPDVGQAAAKVPLALARGARGGFIALNALFLGMDVFFIVKDSMSLARGSETKASKFIRARLALWCSEMTSWQKIYKLLEKGKPSFKRKQAILVTEFYTEEEE
ncbi:apolipoprotein L3-like [Periophthalmus magnuspinnatus]|uniref:apolipoprotein L3-like n=1 Tax=Periophthalmus magnuspinnatus TaxID=409849 RepID=UPI00145AD3C8|nr:apolipoprotein L3-like [Periophthalmus magnuspinnatus]